MAKNRYDNVLRISLIIGAIYFACIAVVHFFGVKIPGLYIYYNVSSYEYQDKIISFLVFGWSIFYYTAANYYQIIKPLLIATFLAVLGLMNINYNVDFTAIDETISVYPFWFQTGLLGVYVSFLFFCHRKADLKKNEANS